MRAALSHDANRFAMVNKDFRLLMRATERNPNVLQCCSRKSKTLYSAIQIRFCEVTSLLLNIECCCLVMNGLSFVATCCRHSEDSRACKQQLVMYCLLFQILFWSVQTTACHFFTCCCRHYSGACKQQLVICYLLLQTF